MVLEKTLESPLDCKEINPVNPKGNQPWIFIGRTDAEGLILWPPDVKNWFIRKDPDAKNWLIGKAPDAGKDLRWEEKGTRENEMVGWHHLLNRHEFEQVLGDDEGQGGLVCCSPWNHKESEMIWCLSNNRSKNTVNYSKGHFLCMWSTHTSIMIFNWVWKTWKCAWQEHTYKVFLIILNPYELYLLKKLLEYPRISSCFFQLSDL